MKKTFYFLLLILTFAFWFLPFNAAEAALVIQAPKYIGLNSGLVPLEIRPVFSRPADAFGVLSLTGLVGSPRWSVGEAGYWSFGGKDMA